MTVPKISLCIYFFSSLSLIDFAIAEDAKDICTSQYLQIHREAAFLLKDHPKHKRTSEIK